jgi:hypothetical protein
VTPTNDHNLGRGRSGIRGRLFSMAANATILLSAQHFSNPNLLGVPNFPSLTLLMIWS